MYVSISSWLVHSLNHTNHIHVLMYIHKLYVCTWSISNPNKTKVHWQTLARLRTFWVVSATVWEEHGLLTTIRGCLSYQHGACFVTQKAWQDSKLQIPRLCNLEYMSWATPTPSALIFQILWVQDSRTAMTQSVDPVAINPKCRLRSMIDATMPATTTSTQKLCTVHERSEIVEVVWQPQSQLLGGVVSSNMYNSYSWKQVGIKQHGL